MKKLLIFCGGVVTGFILLFFLVGVLSSRDQDNRIKMFDVPGDIIEVKSFKVFQVINDDGALVNGKEDKDYDLYLGPVYFLTNDNGKFYYDDEIVEVSNKKVVRQVGIYRYKTRKDVLKTVPIVKIMDE